MNSAHSFSAQARESILVSGILQVLSYDGSEIVAECEGARIVIQGEGLRIASFEQESGRLSIDGRLDAMQYLDERPASEPFFKRIFR
ncbi:MAG: YabP/YqfC family sporulation protein [Oscillospiraceae bacterium]|nr:YabP/YqfC family sporulation protein [Oscillospiraceae bacterium]